MRGNRTKRIVTIMLCLLFLVTTVSGCKKDNKKVAGDEPAPYNTAILYNEQHSSYDETAEKRRK